MGGSKCKCNARLWRGKLYRKLIRCCRCSKESIKYMLYCSSVSSSTHAVKSCKDGIVVRSGRQTIMCGAVCICVVLVRKSIYHLHFTPYSKYDRVEHHQRNSRDCGSDAPLSLWVGGDNRNGSKI